jgi:hypothetical protein
MSAAASRPGLTTRGRARSHGLGRASARLVVCMHGETTLSDRLTAGGGLGGLRSMGAGDAAGSELFLPSDE